MQKKNKSIKQTVTSEVDEGETVPAEARAMHNRARTLGMAGELDKAIELFLQATLFAPEWPQLYFDLGIAYVYKQENKKALYCFKKVDELEPAGFLSTKAALHTLDKEAKGGYTPGTFLAFISAEAEEDPIRKKQILLKLLERTPDFVPAWTEMVNLSESKREQLHYINLALKYEADNETHGYLFIQKAIVLHNTDKRLEAIEILRNVAQAQISTERNRRQARMILESWQSAE